MGKRTAVIVFVFCILGIAVLAYRSLTGGEGGEPDFSWGSDNLKDSVVQIVTGTSVVVPFEFRVGSAASELRFEIKDESLRMKGVSLADTVVPVKNGMVLSKVLFNFQSGAGMKAGHYALTVIARDTAGGKIIREGTIPFAVDLLDLIWKCSC